VLTDEQLALLRLVDEVYTERPYFGTRQMSDYISLHYYHCKRYETRWAYEHLGLHSLAPGPHTSKPGPEHKIYPYLLRDIEIVKPCQVFSTDLTYITGLWTTTIRSSSKPPRKSTIFIKENLIFLWRSHVYLVSD